MKKIKTSHVELKAFQRIINSVKYVVKGDQSVVLLSDKEFIKIAKQQAANNN